MKLIVMNLRPNVLRFFVLFCFICCKSNAQVRTINGRVTDDNGDGLPGVTVLIRGSHLGVVTDADGYYVLSNVNKGDVIVFTFVGFRPKEITVQDSNIINVTFSEEAVFGGVDAQPGNAPWQVLIQRSDQSVNNNICGGTIISDSWIITACHCTFADEKFEKPFEPSQILIYAGVIRLSELGKAQVRRVKRIVRHPKWGRNKKSIHDNDIAMIQLEEPVIIVPKLVQQIEYSYTSSQSEDILKPKSMAIVSGWGRVESGEQPDILQIGSVEIRDLTVAKRQYRKHKTDRVTDNMLAASSPGVDACSGDSGGPLVQFSGDVPILIGIVSYGEGCANKNYFGIYTKVNNYASWIKLNLSS